MSLFDQFETNAEKEAEGVEVQYAPNKDGTIPTFILSRMGKSNKKYAKALDKSSKPYARQLQLGTLAEETAEALFMGVFVKTVLKGWKNVRGRDGKDLPFSPENAIMVLKALPDLYDDLQDKARSAALFREETNEADAGN
ncbi:tail assembly chaperone [Rhodobacter phage RcMotherGoose]|nr:tail assembly chaperone [Rhodobacter phage RcMotherGoose]